MLRLFDITGRLVLSQHLTYGLNEISTLALEKGMYVWVVEAGGERVKTGKVAKL